ncbi:hypothetical protein NBRC116586_13870 [Pseudooceanicola nitratireducens]
MPGQPVPDPAAPTCSDMTRAFACVTRMANLVTQTGCATARRNRPALSRQAQSTRFIRPTSFDQAQSDSATQPGETDVFQDTPKCPRLCLPACLPQSGLTAIWTPPTAPAKTDRHAQLSPRHRTGRMIRP